MGVYRVIGGRRVRGVDPGGEFAADLTEGEETALVDAGHVVIVSDDVATTLPRRRTGKPKPGAGSEPGQQEAPADTPVDDTAAEAGATADTGSTAPDPHGEE